MVRPKAKIDAQQPSAPLFWGIDIGGTNIKLGLVDNEGHTVAFDSISTEEPQGPQSAVDRSAEIVQRLERDLGLSAAEIPRIGLGTPGSMDLRSGRLVEPPNLPHWWDFGIRDAYAAALGRPVSFINDANAAAFGEYWLGIGSDYASMVMLTLGTGVGGGIIVEGELINGFNSFGSECGHILVDSSPSAALCVWGGGRGQLEAYASASGLVQRALERLNDGAGSLLHDRLGEDDAELTAKQIYEAAEEDDAFALEMIDETARWLGIGITTLVHTIDPGLVVLGGAMDFGGPDSAVGRRFLNAILAEFESRTFGNVFAGTKIEFAKLRGDAGYLGAAGYARKEHHSHSRSKDRAALS
ncbi:MAG: ROK family protein [Pirellulaceae bacterium]